MYEFTTVEVHNAVITALLSAGYTDFRVRVFTNYQAVRDHKRVRIYTLSGQYLVEIEDEMQIVEPVWDDEADAWVVAVWDSVSEKWLHSFVPIPVSDTLGTVDDLPY